MTDDREQIGGDRDRESGVPPHLEQLDRRLRGMAFRPRPSLQAKIVRRHTSGGAAGPRWRRPLIATAAAALLGVALWWLAVRSDQAGGNMATAGVDTVVRLDRCCADLDGGGDEDDGVLIFIGRDEAVLGLIVYEDRDRSRSFTHGDDVRLGPEGAPETAGTSWDGLVTLDRCCLDYDAGGPEDDGLFLVGHPPDRLLMAAVYEDRDGDGAASPGDLVRYVLR